MLWNNVENASQPSETKHSTQTLFLILKVELDWNLSWILGQTLFQ